MGRGVALPLFGHRAPTPEQLASYVPAPPKLRVLRADGQRIDLRSRDTAPLLLATRQSWQKDCWSYRTLIPELDTSSRLLAHAVSQVRFYAATVEPGSGDLIPLDDGSDHGLDKQLAADAVYNLARVPFSTDPDGYTARLQFNLGVAGECWVNIDADDNFRVHSTSEVAVSADGRITITSTPTPVAASTRVVDPRNEDLLRMWVPDAEYGTLATSPYRSMMGVAEDVVLAMREQQAAARSRVAANGILLLPDSLSLVRARDEDDEYGDDSVMADSFMADFTEAMLAPIRDDGDAQAVVPIVLRGAIEDLDKVRHVVLQRADAEKLIARQDAALRRLKQTSDVQPEQLDGVGGMNHWGAFAVDARAVREQSKPAAETIAACHLAAFLHPCLRELSHPAEQVKRIVIGCDMSALVENPNRGQDAMDAHTRMVISDEALRKAKGFDEDDAPTPQERIERLARDGRLPVEDVARVLGIRGPERETITVQGDTTRPALPVGRTVDAPATAPGDVFPKQPIPDAPAQQPPAAPSPPPTARPVVAAAAPDPLDGWRVDTDASRRLADIDAALTERVTIAADDAVQRVLERAGARVRTAAGRAAKDKALAASLAGIDAHLIPAAVGREQVEAFTPVADLIADGYDRLHTQVDGWLADAAVQTADAVCAVLGLDPREARGRTVHGQVLSRLTTTAAQAWPILAAALDEAAEDGLFEPDPDDEPQGETSTGLVPVQAITDALAAAGGELPTLVAAGGYGGGRKRRQRRPIKRKPGAIPTTGPATGPIVRGVVADQGGVLIGYQWHYKPELSRTTFDPHKQLDGQRFLSWRDPILATDTTTAWIGDYFHPRDHRGCRCVASIVVGTVEDPESVMAQAIRDAHGDPSRVLFGGTADTPSGTPRPDTADLRSRINAAVDAMRNDHVSTRKGRKR